MGLFSKEPCAICGTEVGMMKRSKLKDKQYICDDCKMNGNPFIRCDRIDLDGFRASVAEMEQAEAVLGNVQLSDTNTNILYHGKNYRIYTNSEEGVFTISTPDTAYYKHRPLFYMSNVREFDNLTGVLAENRPPIGDYHDIITMQTNKDSEGHITGYQIRIPYNDERIREIVLRIDDSIPEEEVHDLWNGFCNKLNGRVIRADRDERERQKMHMQNIAQAANKAAAAAIRGEDVTQVVQDAMERAEEINTEPVPKKGFFARLFGK